jgi:transposase InsO family protein
LQVDASEHGLGGALLQPNDEDKLQAVAYTSCSLTEAETKYAQIEKECLAICHAFQKWDHWLYGKADIVVHTDHQPLEAILNKPLNRAPIRLQRMVMRLQRYSFQTKYKKGSTLLLADTLSRAYLDSPTLAKTTGFDIFRLELDELEPNERLSPETSQTLQRETVSDPQLSKLADAIKNGWPNSKEHLDDALKPFWSYRDELAVYNSIVYKGHQCIVPPSMRMLMLKKIHASHLGAESNIRLARQVLFWPGMRSAIEDMCQACPQCAQYGSAAPTEPMKSLPIPERPWELVSQDICSYKGNDYLITVCHFSDFIEVDHLENLLSTTVIQKTEAHFARYGVPTTCHTDNGPQFISAEYEAFLKTYGFKHTTSSPYHSRGNGKAEAAVRIIKSLLSKSDNINLALLNLRNTPPQGHTYSPAQRMFSRRTRTTLPTLSILLKGEMIDPQVVQQDIRHRRTISKQVYDKHSGPELPPLSVGTNVYTKPPPTKHGQPWAHGQIIENPRARSYTVRTPTGIVRRNRVHLRRASVPPPPMSNERSVPIIVNHEITPIAPPLESHQPVNVSPKCVALPDSLASPARPPNVPRSGPMVGQAMTPAKSLAPCATKTQIQGSPLVFTKSGRQVKKPCILDL